MCVGGWVNGCGWVGGWVGGWVWVSECGCWCCVRLRLRRAALADRAGARAGVAGHALKGQVEHQGQQ